MQTSTLSADLAPLADAIGDSRIVLLGENGHGVGSITEWKVNLVEWLHSELGFEVLVFESGFFECGHVWRRIENLTAADALYQCLKYPFQHAELLPLFELARTSSSSSRPLELAGMDIQEQGFDSEPRPAASYAMLAGADPELASRVASLDTALFLVEDQGGLDDDAYSWAHQHADSALSLYRAAGDALGGWNRWVYRTAEGWVQRLAVRGEAEARGDESIPTRYYEIRDEWMARSISALADSVAGPRKVVVWLHNDHGRYGPSEPDPDRARSAGSYLRSQYGDAAFSIGVFMGSGEVADNGRTVHPVGDIHPDGIEAFMGSLGGDASYLVLRGNPDPMVSEWARSSRPYLRMGIEPLSLVPAEEFDALFFAPDARVPDYEIR